MGVRAGARSAQSKARRSATRTRASARSWADRVIAWLPPPVRGLVERARKDDILLLSGGLAFYATVSIVPLVLLILSIVSLVLGDQRVHQMATAVGKAAPKNLSVDRFIEQIGKVATRTSVVAFITGLWPATAYGAGLSRAFNDLTPSKQQGARGMRGRGLLLVVLLPVFVLGALLGSYAGSKALGSSAAGRVAGAVVALGTGFGGGAVGLMLIYRIFPPVRLRWRSVWVATWTTAASLTFLSLGFVLYLGLANFQEHYATSGLAAFILLAVWVFLAQILMLVGYKLALEREDR
jgi:membrane protein